MKSMKKFLALLLIAMMVLSLIPTAFAEAPTTGTITINNAVNGERYTVYQLFGAALGAEKNDGTYSISYYVDKQIGTPQETNPVYTLLTTNTTLKADFVLTPSSTVEDRYIVTYKDNTTTTLTAADVAAFMSLYDSPVDLAKLHKQTSEAATGDTVSIDGLPFGYYMVKSGEGSNAAVAINSTNPTVNINLKDTRNPSNPDKVEDRTEVYDGASITYNTSVKAVNYATSTSNGTTTTNKVLSYSLTDTPDFGGNVGVAGNDAAWPKLEWVRVYDAAYLADQDLLDDDGFIITGDDGLYDIGEVSNAHYKTVDPTAFAATGHYDINDNVYTFNPSKFTDKGYYNALKSDGTPDYFTIKIPWVDGNGNSIYYPVSYIVIKYKQFIDQDINEVVNTAFDGTYINRVDYKYDISSSNDIEIGDDSTKAFVTGISLRKHPSTWNGDDTKLLTGAKYIAYKKETPSGSTDPIYYSYHEYTADKYAELMLAAQNKYIGTVSGKNISTYADATDSTVPTKAQIDAYMAEHPICHTAWLKEEGEVDPLDYTTFKNATPLTADNSYSTVEIKNLYDDEFYLQEIEAPAGYQCPTVPYLVKVEPNENTESSQLHFTVTISNQNNSALPAATMKANENNFYTAQLVDGESTTLPTTGGKGTLALIAIGLLLFMAAAVVLVTKKRMYNEG